MMVLTDVLGCRRMPGLQGPADLPLEDMLASHAGPVHVVTDWDGVSVSGVQLVSGTGASAVAGLEKRLREQGDTDDFAHVLVHESSTRAGSTTLAFTAVPLKTWRHFHQQAHDQPNLVLLHDWVRTLLGWAKERSWTDGPLVVVSPQGIDVLLFRKQRLHAIERFKHHGESGEALWSRLGQRAASFAQAHAPAVSDASAATALPASACLMLICAGAEAQLEPVLTGLGAVRPVELWAERGSLLSSHILPSGLLVQPFDWDDVVALQSLGDVVSGPMDKLSWLAERWIARVGVVAFAVAATLFVAAELTRAHVDTYGTEMSQARERAQRGLSKLQEAVAQADQLAEEQRTLREWVQKRISSAQIPDMHVVLQRVREALPPGTQIDEVGLVVQDGAHLLTVIGQTDAIEDSLRAESRFAEALRDAGFDIRQRDVLLRNGQPKFKLSLTWSGT
jgi:hypothetical protein